MIKVQVHSADDKGNIITLLEDLVICWNGCVFTIPEGFESDGVSCPRFLWTSVSPAMDPQTLRAGIAHDWIYRTQPKGWTRAESDRMFYDLAREDGLAWIRAEKAYLGLRAFGGKAWNDNKKALKK